MQMIDTKSRAIAGSCHSEKGVHAGLRAGSTVRPRTPLALILSGLIVIGSIAPPAADTAYAKRADLQHFTDLLEVKCEELKRQEGATGKHGLDAKDAVLAMHMREATNAIDLMGRVAEVRACLYQSLH